MLSAVMVGSFLNFIKLKNKFVEVTYAVFMLGICTMFTKNIIIFYFFVQFVILLLQKV